MVYTFRIWLLDTKHKTYAYCVYSLCSCTLTNLCCCTLTRTYTQNIVDILWTHCCHTINTLLTHEHSTNARTQHERVHTYIFKRIHIVYTLCVRFLDKKSCIKIVPLKYVHFVSTLWCQEAIYKQCTPYIYIYNTYIHYNMYIYGVHCFFIYKICIYVVCTVCI